MLRFLLDTDHLTLYQHGHPLLAQRVAAQPPGAVGVSVITVEESLRGRLAVLARAPDGTARVARYGLLEQTVRLFHQFPIASFDQAGEQHFQQLIQLRLRIGTRDLKIAAVVLAHRLVLLTRNRRDFARVPGLAMDDWSL